MLCLTRRSQEKIQVGDNITITVTRVGNGKVRLAIEAPKEMVILRGELLHREAA
jgi:carbon storage regulator